MSIKKIEEQISNKALDSGCQNIAKKIIVDQLEMLRSSNFFENLNIEATQSVIENDVNRKFNSFERRNLGQSDYETLKQTWYDCINSKETTLLFWKKENYEEMSTRTAKQLIQYYEISKKLKHYEPKKTIKFIISNENPEIITDGNGLEYSASKSLIKEYKENYWSEIVENIHFYVLPCPVCSRFFDIDARISYCPECERRYHIAYPYIPFDFFFPPGTPTEYDYDDFSSNKRNRQINGQWGLDDINDIFEGDPDNIWNVD